MTSILDPNRIRLPTTIIEKANFVAGDKVDIAELNNDSLVIQKTKPGSHAAWRSTLSPRFVIAVEEEVFESVNFQFGDVVNFDILDAGIVSLRTVDGTTVRQFTHPEYDELGQPIPPGWLVQAFIGFPDIRSFLKSGPRTVRIISELVRDAGENIHAYEKILDFGCGCGRVLRAFPSETTAKLVGCDLHRDAINWCSQHMKNAAFFQGTEWPDESFLDNEFDLIYAISVLTHLDEQHQDAWLQEWQRILKPGGIAIVTFRAEDTFEESIRVADNNRANEIKRIWENSGRGFAYLKHKEWNGVFDEFYSDTFHTHSYIMNHWSEYFDIVKVVKATGFAHLQSAAVMRKR